MQRLILALLTTIGALTSGLGYADDEACWNAQRIYAEAEELEETALHFAEILETIPEYSHLRDGAANLSEEASHFSEAAAAGESCHHLQEDFQVVYEAAYSLYWGVLDAHNRYQNPHIVQDWNDMVAAYDRVRFEVNQTRLDGGGSRRIGRVVASDALRIKRL